VAADGSPDDTRNPLAEAEIAKCPAREAYYSTSMRLAVSKVERM
jgi:hypothetical protein